MKVHIVFAHPNEKSFNGQLRDVAINTLRYHNWEVTVTNLFQENFKSVANHQDFTVLKDAENFDLQAEQLHASAHNTFTPDILKEQALLDDANAIIFQFPLWWESVPAVIKGYFDRVFSYGWAYGPQYALMGKSVLVSTTTGAPEITWKTGARGTLDATLKPLLKGTLEFCGMEVLPPYYVYGAKTKTEEEKLAIFEAFRNKIIGHIKELP